MHTRFVLDTAWSGAYVLPEEYFAEAEQAYDDHLQSKAQGKQHWQQQKMFL